MVRNSSSSGVQAGRYASGLDPVSVSGRQTGPSTAPQPVEGKDSATASAIEEEAMPFTTVRLAGTDLATGERRSLSIEVVT